MTSRSVLLVDDNVEFGKLLSAVLRSEGYDVQSATTLRLAGDLLTTCRFDVVVCDMWVGDQLGLDLLRERQVALARSGTITIATSGDPSYRHPCKDLGVELFLAKPFLVDELIEMIQHLTSPDA